MVSSFFAAESLCFLTACFFQFSHIICIDVSRLYKHVEKCVL